MSDVEQIEIIAEAVDGSAGRRRWLQLRDEVSVSVSVSVCVCVCGKGSKMGGCGFLKCVAR